MLSHERTNAANEQKSSPLKSELKEKEEDKSNPQTPVKSQKPDKENVNVPSIAKKTEQVCQNDKNANNTAKPLVIEEQQVHKKESVPVDPELKPDTIQKTEKNENLIKSDAKTTNNQNPVQNEINIENVLKPNSKLSNQESPKKMNNSVTQDKIINNIKSEVYDEITKQALNEVNQ